jgi:geranylgeranyl diphosphate synthase type II
VTLDLEAAMDAARARVDARLAGLVPESDATLPQAMRYALLGPGKRLRPILCLWAHDWAAGSQPAVALDVACSFECVHAYSLVHDDLPCMDDDDLRRGRPTCHVRYGEGIAVLVGDALLNLAYETLLAAAWDDASTARLVARTLAEAASHRGLVGGQALDLESEGLPPTRDRLEAIHSAKTGALIRAALVAGAQIAHADRAALDRLATAGMHLGLAFQIADDALDVTGGAGDLGKNPGKDAGARKMTYPALMGVEAARALAVQHAEAAADGFGTGPAAEPLRALAAYCVQRRR